MIRSNEQLLCWLTDKVSGDIVLRKAFELGGVEYHGVFDPLPGSERKGWIISVTVPQFRKEYIVAVPMNQFEMPVNWYQINYFPQKENECTEDETRVPRRFDRIKKCASVHLPKNWHGSDHTSGKGLDAERRTPPAVPTPTDTENKKVVHDEETY